MAIVSRVAGLDGISGDVTYPSDPTYGEVRQTFNGMLDRRPAVIVGCRSTEDVVAAVKAARAAGLPIAVRGGGHGVAGTCMGDGALVVDLRAMRSVDVDPTRRRARAQGGAQWLDIDTATTAHDLATTGGTFIDTGIGGLTLGGGMGFLMGTSGLTCDNLVRAVVVTAGGEVVIAGEGGDTDLLWALRGGGGNFGVVTEFEYRLQPLGPLQSGRVTVPLAQGRDAMAALADVARTMPDELAMFAVGPSPLEPPLPDGTPTGPDDQIRCLLLYQGELDAAEASIAGLRAGGWSGALGPTTYAEMQASSGVLPFGLRHYWKGHFIRDLEPGAIDVVIDGMTDPPVESGILLEAVNGAARTEPTDGGAAFGQREARWNVTALGIWLDAADDDRIVAWARGFADRLRPYSLSGAGYGNYATSDETAERVRAGFGADRFARLARVKRRLDPDNVFRFNNNIPPAAS